MFEKLLEPRRAAFISVLSNTILTVSKLILGYMIGSVAVISEGFHSGLDLIASVIAFCSVSVSSRPPDKEHPYGHGKIENISGAVEALLIIVAGALITKEAVEKLRHGGEVGNPTAGLIVMGISVLLNFIVSRILFKSGKKHDSAALIADGHHLSTDIMTSLGVFIGLILMKLTGWGWVDPVAALVVAGIIVFVGGRVLLTSFAELLDHTLPAEEEKLIRDIIERHRGLFVSYHKLRTRKAGAIRYIDLHLEMSPDSSLKHAHDFCDHIQKDITAEFPTAQILIHIEPYDPNHVD